MTPRILHPPISNVETYNVLSLDKMYTANSIRIDENYQTGERWSKDQMQVFIDSLIRGIDIPKLYFDVHRNSNEVIYYVVDGQQRTKAIHGFLAGDFPLSSDADPVGSTEIAGKYYDDLDPHFVMENIDIRSLHIVHLENYTRDRILDIFLRYNSMTTLNAAEKRNAIPGNMPKIIKKLANHRIFKDRKYISLSPRRKGHQNVSAGIMHQIIHNEIVDIRPVSIANTYRANADITEQHCSIRKIKKAFQFLIRAFHNKTNPQLKKYALMRLTFLVTQMLEEFNLSEHEDEFGKAFIAFERKRIENNELPESDQDPEIVAFNDAARGDKVSDMTYIHNMLKRHFVRSIPTLNLKDRQRSFSQEQRYVIYMNSNKHCKLCEDPIKMENFHADHIYPWSKGGETSISNGQALCSACNIRKSNGIQENVTTEAA